MTIISRRFICSTIALLPFIPKRVAAHLEYAPEHTWEVVSRHADGAAILKTTYVHKGKIVTEVVTTTLSDPAL